MSYLEAEGLSKSELKNRLTQMGMSLDKYDHPKDYYMQLYLDKYNAKNKVTRDNTPFYKEQVLRGKRERDKSYDAQNYDEVEYEEEDEGYNYGDDDDEDYVYEESEESNENKIRRRKRKAKTIKFDEKNYDYRESGIKKIRLIRSKKKKILKNKARDENEQNNVKKNIFVVSIQDQKAGQNNEYYTNNYNNNHINENNQGLNVNNGQNYIIKNNEYNTYSNNAMPDDRRKMIKLKVEKLYCDGDNYNRRNQYQDEKDLDPNNYNRKENQYYSVETRENYNQNLRSNNNSANSKNNNNNYFNSQYRNSNGSGSQKYNYFIRSITKTVKDDLEKNPMSSKPKNILVNSDSMNKMEGYNEYNNNNSNNNLRSSPYQDDMDMNNQEVVEFNRILKGRNKEAKDQRLFSDLPKDQIVSDSIKETKIMDQYNNSPAGKSGNKRRDNNYDSINEYKKKLRSYSKNNGSNLPEEDNDYNNNYSQNNNNNGYINDDINSSNQNYNNANDNNYEVNNNISNINTDFNNENMGNNLRNSNKFNNKSNNRSNLNEFSSLNYNNQGNMNDTNGIYEKNNYSGYNNQTFSNNYSNQNDTNNQNNLNEFNSGNYNTQGNMNDTNAMYESNQNNDNNLNYTNQNNLNDEHRIDYSNNYNNNQNDLNQYGENLDQRIKYNNDGNNSIINSNIFDKSDMNNYNNNNQFSGVVNDNNMRNNYDNGDYESTLTDDQSRFSFWKSGRNLKNNIMDKFRKYIYIFPFILLIALGIAYFLSNDENYSTTIIYCFSAIMGLLVLYLLFKYIKDKKRYEKMAREDREEMLNELQRRNIRNENLIVNTVLLNNFIERRIEHHKVTQDEYINYVFPYLQKFLKKDGLELSKEENPINYWIEI